MKDNQNNLDFNDESKVTGIGFKIFSTFSKNKKHTIEEYNRLQGSFSKLEDYLRNTKDFSGIHFNGTLEKKKQSLTELKNNITDTSLNFDSKVKTEFLNFNLHSILKIQSNHLLQIQVAIDNSNHDTKNLLQSIQTRFNNYLTDLNSLFQMLTKELSESKDIRLSYSFEKSYMENKELLPKIQSQLDEILSNFDSIIQEEFTKMNLIQVNTKDISIESLTLFQEKVNNLANQFKEDDWTKSNLNINDCNSLIVAVESVIKEKNSYFHSENDLFTIEFKWSQFYNPLPDNDKAIIHELKSKTNWKKVFFIFYIHSLLLNHSDKNLPTNDDELKELDTVLNGIEKQQLSFIKEFWFSKQTDAAREFVVNSNDQLSVENLYNKRSSKNFKRLSLRQIIQKDIHLFSTFFPVILTSPDVACNLFKGKNGYFDIVMFDEASQLRTEDNLPATLKGKQIIIAGDEHQMPPSNYFSKVFEGSVEDEDDIEEEEITVDKDNILLSCESLLDFAEELNFQKKYLDFHYRSKHPYLIDFSNYAFYNQRLRPLPKSFDYIPIKYIQVNGTFYEHINEAEADMVLSILEKSINRFPDGKYPTVGIATFNITQRNLIQSKIIERKNQSKYESFNTKVQELEDNGMFIKNLENIQGDERDIIILSTTYGIGKEGNFAQRFGPINHSKGYKLLNVIITRAKYKVYCCTSIPENVFINYKDHLLTEGSNNKKAVFYAYLAYCKAVSESNEDLRLSVLNTLSENSISTKGINSTISGELESPFEEEVYLALVNHVGEDKIIPQFQFAGFRIDLVYDSKIANVPKIAIECDGAKYHSSREAYLYDRHRQKILESYGFVFHRIWSTNWWRNPSRETKRLISFINEIESTKSARQSQNEKMSMTFVD